MSSGGEPGYPRLPVDSVARLKAVLQMLIGGVRGWLAWAFLLSHRIGNCVPAADGGVSGEAQRPRLLPVVAEPR
jgi:hypothetical protein